MNKTSKKANFPPKPDISIICIPLDCVSFDFDIDFDWNKIVNKQIIKSLIVFTPSPKFTRNSHETKTKTKNGKEIFSTNEKNAKIFTQKFRLQKSHKDFNLFAFFRLNSRCGFLLNFLIFTFSFAFDLKLCLISVRYFIC